VHELQTRITELKQRKDAALHRKQPSGQKHSRLGPRTKPALMPKQIPPPSTPVASSSKADSKEEEFWHTPGAAARTLCFTHEHKSRVDMLTDEELDLANVTASFENSIRSTETNLSQEDDRARLDSIEQKGGDEPEDTIILPPPLFIPHALSAQEGRSETQSTTTIETPRGLRVNTEVERIIARIWATVGDIFMPGSPYSWDHPPKAKELITHLQSFSTAPLSPTPSPRSSPSLSSHSNTTDKPSKPSSQQILISHLLLSLLSSPPHFSMSLRAVKEELAARAQADISKREGEEARERGAITIVSGQNTTRALYALVAKRLVKIERGGGEQIVKFDM